MQFLQRNFAVDSVIEIYTKTWKLGHKLKHKLENKNKLILVLEKYFKTLNNITRGAVNKQHNYWYIYNFQRGKNNGGEI